MKARTGGGEGTAPRPATTACPDEDRRGQNFVRVKPGSGRDNSKTKRHCIFSFVSRGQNVGETFFPQNVKCT